MALLAFVSGDQGISTNTDIQVQLEYESKKYIFIILSNELYVTMTKSNAKNSEMAKLMKNLDYKSHFNTKS